ncbi:MAG: radical SAM protein, partial [Ruminococcaceae bacterium]|nr:radical SAM protein [Oscillospiraceae bacterium]
MAAAVVAVVAAEDVEDAEIDMICMHASRLLLQFHITGRCNLQCKHCYRTEGDVETLSFDAVISVMEQFKELRKEYNLQHNIKRKGHINITGGEPFFRKDMKQILTYLGENKKFFTYGILSNGSFIDDEMISILKKTEVSFVQLSIDGNKEMHDSLRAPGDYDRVLKTAEYLEKKGIRTYISFTANKENYKYLPIVARECRKRNITKLWSDRLVPIGNGQELESLVITKGDFSRYLKSLKKAQGNWLIRHLYPKTQVAMNRALQFQNSNGAIYSCSAGDSLITVDEFGNIMPCRRMPVVC